MRQDRIKKVLGFSKYFIKLLNFLCYNLEIGHTSSFSSQSSLTVEWLIIFLRYGYYLRNNRFQNNASVFNTSNRTDGFTMTRQVKCHHKKNNPLCIGTYYYELTSPVVVYLLVFAKMTFLRKNINVSKLIKLFTYSKYLHYLLSYFQIDFKSISFFILFYKVLFDAVNF